MPSKWYERVRKDGKLTVYNDAGAWAKHVNEAIKQFNLLPLHITLTPASSERDAHVTVILADGKTTSRTYDRRTITAKFDAALTHGQTGSWLDSKGKVEKCIIFLPQKLAKVSDDVKMCVVVHELIHSCGLVEPTDHDPADGIMVEKLQLFNGKLREASMDKSLEGMPPIRLGNWTKCKIAELWQNETECKQ